MHLTLGMDSRFMNSLNGIGRDSRSIVSNLAKKRTSTMELNYSCINIELTGFLTRIRAYVRLAMFNKQTFISQSSQLDIFLSPQVSPFASKTGKNVVRIHDLFPLQYPEYFKRRSVWLFQRSIQIYPPKTIFLFNSESTRDSFKKLFPEKYNKTYVLYCEQAQLSELRQCEQCEGCEYLYQDQSDKRYILLAVGTLEPRKNYETLITAYRNHEIRSKYQLIICGNDGWGVRGLKRILQNEEIKLLQYLCDGSLAELYKLTKLFVSCSFDEGFNLPACEANAAGIPLILSDIPAHRELYSSSGIYFDPRSSKDLVLKIQSFDDRERLTFKEQKNTGYNQLVYSVFKGIVNEE